MSLRGLKAAGIFVAGAAAAVVGTKTHLKIKEAKANGEKITVSKFLDCVGEGCKEAYGVVKDAVSKKEE